MWVRERTTRKFCLQNLSGQDVRNLQILKKSATIPDTAHMPGIIAEIKKRRETRIGITAPLPIKKVARNIFLRPRCHKMSYLYLFEKKLSIYFFKTNLKKT